jgi:GMP synthase (glutamine-hydrolysing)
VAFEYASNARRDEVWAHDPGKPRPVPNRFDCPTPDHSTPGRIGIALKAMDVRLDIRRPSCGEQLPDRLADHDAVVVFGGPMGANDTLDWVRREIEWLQTPLAEDKPLLGVCLAAQMLARALGARVFSYDDKRSEIGYIIRSSQRSLATGCAQPRSRARSINGILTASICLKAPELLAVGGANFPQSSLSLPLACSRPAVSLGSYLSHDVPLDPSRR